LPTEKSQERGVRSPYQARYGITIGKCEGLQLDHDTSMIKDEALVNATNVRVHDGILVCRFGESAPTNSSPLAGCVQGLIDINGGGPRFVLAMVRPDTIASSSDVDIFDRSLSPAYQRVTDPPSSNRLVAQPSQGIDQSGSIVDDTLPRYVYLWWNDQIIFGGTGDKLWRFLFPDDDFSVDGIQVEELLTLQVPGEGSTFKISSMCTLPESAPSGSSAAASPKMGPPLYFGTVGGGVVAYVNGEFARLQAEATFASRVIVFEYNNRLYAVGRQELRVQDGWVTGGTPTSTSWSNVTLPGAVTDFAAMCAVEYGGFGLIGGSDVGGPRGSILQIDDSSGSPVVTEVNDGDPLGLDIRCFDDFAVALGGLYVSWRYHPGVTEKATFSTLTAAGVLGSGLGDWTEDGMIPRLLGVRDALYISAWASGTAPGGGSQQALWQYDGSNLSELTAIADPTATEVAPFDMVGF
jgi:hypothetical protein